MHFVKVSKREFKTVNSPFAFFPDPQFGSQKYKVHFDKFINVIREV